MSFSWITRTLHSTVLSAFVFLGLLFVLEGGIVIYYWFRVDHYSNQLELAQEGRLQAQQTSLELQSFLSGQRDQLPTLVATARETNDLFTQLQKGGYWKGREVLPPSDLQKISLEKVAQAWREYHSSVSLLTTQEIWKDSTLQRQPEPDPSDSVASVAPATVITMMNPKVAEARALVGGQWLRLATLVKEFQNDAHRELARQRTYLNGIIAIVVLIDMVVLGFYYFYFRKNVLIRLQKLTEQVAARHPWDQAGQDEIADLGGQLNQLITQIHHASDYVMRIGEGKLDEQFGNTDDESKLTQALNGMQAKLKVINEEDQKRRWANEGLTKFVDILRSGNDNIHVLGDRVISTLVQYTNSNQGGLYLVEGVDSDKYLELISLFAFNTKKFEQQKLKPGEGLVGQCFLEKETIFLTEIPDDYIRISSGLGASNPKSILIVPLKVDREIYGIVELASFQVYQAHEISFVEKLGETIASTLSSVRNNQKTKKLLEDFRQQAEQMHSQEEEMRQNMEELTATQEEMSRKEQDYILKIRELEARPAQVVRSDDWQVAEEMARTLQTQLSLLETAQKAASES